MAVSRKHLLGLVVADVVLFVLSNATSKTNRHPGTVSDILWGAFLIGVLLLIVLVIVVVVRSRRPRAR